MTEHGLDWLRLHQVADSALPIGTLAHSYGLETLVDERLVSVDRLASFLADYLAETGRVEAYYFRKAHQAAGLPAPEFAAEWLRLNFELDALKLARESREASNTLGRRFLGLVLRLDPDPVFELARQTSKSNGAGTHYCAAFGLTCGRWQIDLDSAVLAFLQQSVVALVSACQRLMALGQTEATRLIWEIKPAILRAAQRAIEPGFPRMFTAALEVASMRHPDLATRLFIS